MVVLPPPTFVALVQQRHQTSSSTSDSQGRGVRPRFLAGHLQGDVVRHSLGLCEVLGLVLRDDVPRDAVVDAVLQQHRPVHGVGAAHVAVAAVCLCWAPNLQDKHDFAEKHEGKLSSHKVQDV